MQRQFHAVHPNAVDAQAHVSDNRVVTAVHPVVVLAQHGAHELALREALDSRPRCLGHLFFGLAFPHLLQRL
eukprot:4440931-Pyramimonas_sp.AAC.1